jgi:imidazolonepropionase-like amidohydrolase
MRDLAIIRDGALLIRHGRVVEVGPARRIENLDAARRAVEINLAGRVAMPGLIDAHTAIATDPGLARLQTARVRACFQSAAQLLLRHGTTLFATLAGGMPTERDEMRVLRALRSIDGAIPIYTGQWRERAMHARLAFDNSAFTGALTLSTGYKPIAPSPFNLQSVIAASGWPIEEAISACTINAAYAVGFGETAGSLEPGKRADVVVLDAEDIHDMVNHPGGNLVSLVVKEGEIVHDAHRVCS